MAGRARRAVTALGLLLLIALGLWWSAPVLAQWAIEAVARRAGLDALAFRVEEVGWNHLALGGLSLAAEDASTPSLEAERLELRWGADLPRSRRVHALVLKRLTLRGRADADGWSFGPLDAWLRAGDGAGTAPPLGIARLVAADTRLEIATPRGDLVGGIDLDLALDSSLQGELHARLSGPQAATDAGGETDGDLAASIALSLDERGELATEMRGSVPGELLAAALGQSADVWPERLRARLAGSAELGHPLALSGERAAPLAETLRGAAGRGRLELEADQFGAAGEQIERARVGGAWSLGDGGFGFRSHRLEIARSGRPVAEGHIAVSVRPGSEGAWRLEDVDFALEPWATPHGLVALAASGSADASAADASLTLDAALELTPARAEGRAPVAKPLRLAGPLALRWSPESTRVEFPDCLELSLPSGARLFGTQLQRDASLCLVTQPGEPVSLRPGEPAQLEAHIEARAQQVALAIGRSADPLRLSGRRPVLQLRARGEPGQPLVALGLRAERMDFPDAQLSLRGVDLDGEWDLAREFSLDGNFAIDALVDVSAEGRFPPVAGRGRFEADARSVRIARARASELGGALRARGSARHTFASGAGRAEVDLEPLRFGPAAGTAVLERWLGSAVRVESGEVGGSARFHWDAAGLGAALDLGLLDLALSLSELSVRGLTGRLVLAEVTPVRTDGLQTLRFSGLDAGFPWGGGELHYALEPHPQLRVEAAHVELAGGRLEVRGALDLAGGDAQRLEVRLVDVGVTRLLELVPVEGLAASGRLSGVMELAVEDGRPVLRGGRIRANEGGWIRYRPEETAGALADSGPIPIGEIMRDFHYEKLGLSLEGWLDREVGALVELHGSNPAFQDGHPVHLTLNIRSAFGELFRALPTLQALLDGLTAGRETRPPPRAPNP